jgi:hypothetical protein
MLDNLNNINLFKIGVIVLLLINSGLLIYITVKQHQNKTNEGWSNTNDYSEEEDYGQKTYAGCSCTGYGFKNKKNMPFGDDSNLYARTIYQGY